LGGFPVVMGCVSILYPAPHGVTQELGCLLVQGMSHQRFGSGGALVCLRTLQLDPLLVSPFRPVAVDRISIVGNIDMAVFDALNLFSVHDQPAQLITVRKRCSEKIQ
jgi:hypothetical protein